MNYVTLRCFIGVYISEADLSTYLGDDLSGEDLAQAVSDEFDYITHFDVDNSINGDAYYVIINNLASSEDEIRLDPDDLAKLPQSIQQAYQSKIYQRIKDDFGYGEDDGPGVAFYCVPDWRW